MRKVFVLGGGLLLVQLPLLALTLLQERTWGGPAADAANRVAFAGDGGVYVAGTTITSDGDADAFLLKYDANRNLEWERAYGFPDVQSGFDQEFVAGLSVGSDNAAYVSGQLGTGVLFVAKFDAAGNLIWDTTYGANGTIATGSAIDAAGNIYVSAMSFVLDPQNDTEALLIKFDANGGIVWARAWGGVLFDASRGVAVGSDGVYVAGETNSFFANDAFLIKFDFDGTLVWERTWGVDGVQAPFTGLTSAFGVATDGVGNVYFTGNTFESGHLKNIVLVKFTSAGDLVWNRVGGPGFGAGGDLAVSPDNLSLFVSGNILSDDPDFFGGLAFVAEFTADGKAKKGNTFGGDLSDSASADSIVVNSSGLIVAAGVAGAPPHEFGRNANSAKNPSAHLVIPEGDSHVVMLPIDAGADSGTLLPVEANVGGGNDAFTVWLQR
jgi:hypothetical protein